MGTAVPSPATNIHTSEGVAPIQRNEKPITTEVYTFHREASAQSPPITDHCTMADWVAISTSTTSGSMVSEMTLAFT